MPPTDTISTLRAQLATLSGKARIGGLMRLGQALAERYWRTGPGQPAALPDLDAAIDATQEAYGHFDRDDPLRGRVGTLLGWLLSARHTAHLSPEHDRDTGIAVLEEALAAGDPSPAMEAMARIALGQLLLRRVLDSLRTPTFAVGSFGSGAASAPLQDADRATACLRAVLTGRPVSEEVTQTAQTLLDLTGAVRSVLDSLGGGLAGLTPNRLMEVMGTLQRLVERAGGQRGAGLGGPATPGLVPSPPLSFFDADTLAALDPLDRPVALMQDSEASAPPAPQVGRPAPAAPVDIDQLRQTLHHRLSTMVSGAGHSTEAWALGIALLRPTTPVPASEDVDELVALASLVVDGDTAAAPETGAVDRLLLAVSLHLRHRLDGPDEQADRIAGAEALVAAAQMIPLDHPAAVATLGAAGAFLDPGRPFGGALDLPCGSLADRVDVAIATGAADAGADLATLHALRCLCRAAADDLDDGIDLQRVVGTVPVEYPWLANLRAAAGSPVRLG